MVINSTNINKNEQLPLILTVFNKQLAASAVDRVFESRYRVNPKTIKLKCVAAPVSTQHYGERAKIRWLGIKIMCPSGAT
jgi:hypothetical protein